MKQYEIWLVNMNPSKGTEVGKVRPAVIIQTDLLNDFHPSVIVCPLTTNINKEIKMLRVHVGKKNLDNDSDILVDQITAIDKKRLIKKLGKLNEVQIEKLRDNLKVVLFE
ncbi:MAG: type II toxin-antitoxin system PemK/MazF family toxin [Chitinophagia bacterium]|jgi:mRNA interferase MazF|nr:type II toxin-antitoxin system PemK/MazF family toxin [Chitinophagia bacterium]